MADVVPLRREAETGVADMAGDDWFILFVKSNPEVAFLHMISFSKILQGFGATQAFCPTGPLAHTHIGGNSANAEPAGIRPLMQ